MTLLLGFNSFYTLYVVFSNKKICDIMNLRIFNGFLRYFMLFFMNNIS